MCPLMGVLIMSASVVDFTWMGAAGDGDWNNTANWDVSGIPVDDALGGGVNSGLSLSESDTITFACLNMPTINVPGYGGDVTSDNGGEDSPTMLFNSGGSISFDLVGRNESFWKNLDDYERTILTVCDGVTGVGEDVEVTFTGLTRLSPSVRMPSLTFKKE